MHILERRIRTQEQEPEKDPELESEQKLRDQNADVVNPQIDGIKESRNKCKDLNKDNDANDNYNV